MIALEPQARILILKLSAIGDVLMATPTARALRERYPRATLAWAVQPKAAAMLEDNPHLNTIHLVRSNRLRHLLQAGLAIRRARYDAVLDLQGQYKTVPLLLLCGARHRLVSQYAEIANQRLATAVVPLPVAKTHALDRYLSLAGFLDAPPDGRQMEVCPGLEATAAVDQFLQEHKALDHPLVGLNLSASRPIKQWPLAQFVEVAQQVVRMGAIPVLLGGPTDRAIAARFQEMSAVEVVVATGRLNLRQSAALLQRCRVVVTADTGPMHLAVAVGTPVVAIFGPTDPELTGPIGDNCVVVTRDLACRPCLQQPTCQRTECMTELPAAMVLREVVRFL